MKKLFIILFFNTVSLLSFSQGWISYYPFNGNANDEAGPYNGVGANVTPTQDRFGNPNSAFHFTAVSFVTLANVMNNVFAGPGKKFSISAWIKPDKIMNNGIIIAKTADTGCDEDQRGWVFRVFEGKISFSISDKLRNSARLMIGNTIISNTNKWYHVVITYDATIQTNNGLDRVRLFVDNVEETISFPASYPPVGPLGDLENNTPHIGIGNYLTSTGVPCQQIPTNFEGNIDDIGIFNKVLTPEEIDVLYHITMKVKSPPVYPVHVIKPALPGDILVYPTLNTEGVLYIKNIENKLVNYYFKIYNVIGQLIVSDKIDRELVTVDFFMHCKGTYFITIYDPENKIMKVEKMMFQ